MEFFMKMVNVNELKGKTIVGMSCYRVGNELFEVRCSDNSVYLFQNIENSERVYLDEELDDSSLVMNSPLTLVKRVVETQEVNNGKTSYLLTWTVFHFETENGMLLVGFRSKSYKLESVDVNVYQLK
jgi:ribosomal protein S18 acetylase RimI-like enzyme